ncbi:MAG: hypothetical protein D3926_20020 [Desulfobacteraceae bacterium]|nr:MAG: hypothetical protein D3926_20020 [Desulfobacteraceae bacterium]
MKLQEKLNQMKAQFESTAPPEVLAAMHKATEDLKNSDLVGNAIKQGDPLPEFSLPDQNGNQISSGALLEKGSLVLSVYRGVW